MSKQFFFFKEDKIDIALMFGGDRRMRKTTLMPGFVLNSEQIERGLKDENVSIRRSFAGCEDIRLSPEQVERALKDEDEEVQLTIIERLDFAPTAIQVERGLTSTDEVRRAFYKRVDIPMTPVQIERALAEPAGWNLLLLINKRGELFTPEQIEGLLLSKDEDVRYILTKKPWFRPNETQFDRLSKDKDEEVSHIFEKRKVEWLSNLQALDLKNRFQVENKKIKKVL